MGEFCCVLVFFTLLRIQKQSYEHKINPMLLAIPLILDVGASSSMYIAITMCAPSVLQMTRASLVLMTSFLAVMFLGRKLKMHHYVALGMIVFAICIISIVGVINSPDDKDQSNVVKTSSLGIFLVLIA